MRLLEDLHESLSSRDKYIYAKEAIEAEDIEDLEEIVHEIFFYDKKLFTQINKFPKDKSFEEIKNNILKHLGYYKIGMSEGLTDISRDFDFARDNWEKLNLDIDFDSALEKWNQTSKLAEKDFYAKPLYNKLAWDNMVEMFSNDNIKEEPEAAEYEPLEQEELDSDVVDKSTANESLKEDFSNYDLINYNDFLADSFDGWSDDIDYLIKDLNKVAKALRTSAQKLVFYIDYNEEFWAVDEIADVMLYLSEDYSIYAVKDLDIKFAAMTPDNVWIFKNEQEANKIISSIKKAASYSEEDELKEELIKHKKLVKNFFDIINESLTHM